MGQIGPFQILIILGIALLLFGATRIADVGKGLGEGIRNFKKGLRDDDDPARKQLPKKTAKADDDEDESEDEPPPRPAAKSARVEHGDNADEKA